MRAAQQPPPDAPLTEGARTAAMTEAVREVAFALVDTTGILTDVATLVLEYLEKPDEIDQDSLRRLCERAIEFAKNVSATFALSPETNPLDDVV